MVILASFTDTANNSFCLCKLCYLDEVLIHITEELPYVVLASDIAVVY